MRIGMLLLAGFLAVAGDVHSGDWPQILGPDRNGQAHDESLADRWPETGPPEIWQREVGDGFAGVAVAGDKAVLFHRVDDSVAIELMHADNGRVIWKTDFPTSFTSGFSSDNGPRCVPIIHEQHVYVFSAEGYLKCLELKSGDVVWTRDTRKDFGAPEGYFGAGSSPLIEGDMIVANVGGRAGAAVVAFDRLTGETRWQSFDDTASYSSPIAATIDGVRHLIVVTRLHTVSVDPGNGTVRWQFPFGKRGPTVNGANPVLLGKHLFLTASYGVGSLFGTIEADKISMVWEDETLFASQYATCIQHDGMLIGFDGRQDAGRGTASLTCFNPATRDVRWTQPNLDYGTVIAADNKLITLTFGGDLTLIDLTADSFRELAKARVLQPAQGGYRLPALSNGRLFVRDESALKCLNLRR